jgi:hypothetical protein
MSTVGFSFSSPFGFQAAPSTSAPTKQPATPIFSFGSPSTASITPTTQASDVISVNTVAQKQLDDMKTRLRSEYQDLLAHPVKHAVAAPSPENPLIWTGTKHPCIYKS